MNWLGALLALALLPGAQASTEECRVSLLREARGIGPIHVRDGVKPDGRYLLAYYDHANADVTAVPAPGIPASPNNQQIRYSRFDDTWVSYVPGRAGMAPVKASGAFFDPFEPTRLGERPTEIPDGPWKVVVFQNAGSSFSPDAAEPPALFGPLCKPGFGFCEVLVYDPDREKTLGLKSREDVAVLIEVWIHRTRELGAIPGVEYVAIGENSGALAAASQPHPHEQIFGYPSIPPRIRAEMTAQEKYPGERSLVQLEIDDARAQGRIVSETETSVVFVPFAPKNPYEARVAPKRRVARPGDLTAAEKADLAESVRDLAYRYGRLFENPSAPHEYVADPYNMGLFQAPPRGEFHTYHFTIIFEPKLRSVNQDGPVEKRFGTSESNFGHRIIEGTPEDQAAKLRGAGTR
jgi:UDPglucose--hexose-1-phosphate uridylyltransferase